MWNGTENQITLVLIRHGETKSNVQHRYLGKGDEDLIQEACSRLEKDREKRRFLKVDEVYCSPMKRCLKTAKILYPEMEINVIDQFREMDFGDFEGKNYLDLRSDIRYQRWIDSNGTLPFPGGESRKEFVHRTIEGFLHMVENIQSGRLEINKIALVVHGGTIMALLSHYHGGNYFDYRIPNGEGYVCTLLGKEQMRITDLKRIP